MATDRSRSSDFKALYGKIERALAHFQRIQDSTELLEVVMETLVRDFRDDLGFEMGRLYRREEQDFILCCTYGGSRHVPIGFKVPRDYPPHVRTLAEGLLIMGKGGPGYDEQFEWAVGVTSTFAAIAVGPDNSHVLAFSVNGSIKEEHILYSLSAVRHVINLKLEERKLAGIIEEARIIQESLLPVSAPDCPGYDIHGESRASEVVGGDLYDYLEFPGCALRVAIADAAGHGLPAALVARDVITGLRMGKESGATVVRTVERLNRVINR
ncbi:MAG: SpoIIE family protein phosphatase, partial [Candidatus Eisenbacteria bacterium]|nr:SpoIIE family protein phosphatase [Candidatus Eisenbacteria bacterium]